MGNNFAGLIDVIAMNSEDSLVYRLMIAGVETTLDSAKITILNPSRTEIVTQTNATVSGSSASYLRTWAEATFPVDYGYIAQWELTHSGGTIEKREAFFLVSRRRFESQLSDTDLTSTERMTLPDGDTSFSAFRNNAWNEIEATVSQEVGTYAGNVFFPEQFFLAHKYLSWALFFQSRSIDPDSMDAKKAEDYYNRSAEQVSKVLSVIDVDLNEDGIIGDAEKALSFSGVRVLR